MEIHSSMSRSMRLGSLFATSAAVMLAGAAQAAPAGPPQAQALEEVVVTARRTDESLQKVPVAVSVVSPLYNKRRGSFEPQDLPALATGLSVVASIGDRSNVTYSIRGQNQAFSTLFPAVITYFNEVPVTHVATGNFFDLENVQVLRGPQGVLFGRVTDGGNVLLTPKHPTNALEGYIQGKVGDYNLHSADGAINLPIVPDKLLVRVAFEIDSRDGFTKNDFNGQKLDNVASEAYRVGVTFRPTDWLDNYTVVNYQHIHNHGTSTVLSGLNPAAVTATAAGVLGIFPGVYGINANGQVVPFAPGLTPATAANYVANLQAQLAAQQARGTRHVFLTTPSFDRQDNLYAVNTTTIDLSPDIQLKNIVGYVTNKDVEASNFSGDNSALVATCHSACLGIAGTGSSIPFNRQEQLSEEIRLAGKSFDRKLTWSLGGYADHQRPNGQYQNDTVNVAILHRTNVQYSDTWSKAVFAYAEYDASNFVRGLKFNGGFRYTEDKVKSSTATYIAPIVAPAAQPTLAAVLQFGLGMPPATAAALANGTVNLAIPFGQCVTLATPSLFGPFNCRSYTGKSVARTWTAGASYELESGQLFYVKGSRGYRPGGINGSSPPTLSPVYNPEFDTSIEAGVKADWNFDGVLARTNLAVFHDKYSNIQKGVVLPGPVPLQVVRNVAKATIQGVEFEGTLRPTRDLTFGVNYAYTDAHFAHQDPFDVTKNPCDPNAVSIIGFCTDNRLAFTPRHQLSLNVDYRLPVDEALGEMHVGGRYFYQSSTALTDTSALNPASIEPGYGLVDLTASWTGVYGRPIDVNLFVTNVTNKLYRTGNDNLLQRSSLGVLANIYAPPRMFGVAVKYRFGGAS